MEYLNNLFDNDSLSGREVIDKAVAYCEQHNIPYNYHYDYDFDDNIEFAWYDAGSCEVKMGVHRV